MKKVLSTVITLFLLPLLGGLTTEVLKPILPAALPAALRWMQMLTEGAFFPWALAGGVGFLLGLWTDGLVSAFDGRHPLTKAGKAKLLATEVEFLALRCNNFVNDYISMRGPPEQLIAETYIMGRKMDRLGISGPHFEMDEAQDSKIHKCGIFFRAIAPALREGDIATAKLFADEIRRASLVERPVSRNSWR